MSGKMVNGIRVGFAPLLLAFAGIAREKDARTQKGQGQDRAAVIR